MTEPFESSRAAANDQDWLSCLRSPYRSQLLEQLQKLPFESTQRYPPPKRRGGLPIGHELRVARRFLRNESSVLDPSALSGLYRASAPSRVKSLYRTLVLGDGLRHEIWREVLGAQNYDAWTDMGLLDRTNDGAACRFRVITIAGVRLLADPRDEHITDRIHIGQDTLTLIDYLRGLHLGRIERFLDVGSGSGAVLLALSAHAESAVGIDINPRAVEATRFNIDLNQKHWCRAEQLDVFTPADMGTFDLITWNLPFVFMPEHLRDEQKDGYGGHLGIELTLRFVERLTHMLTDGGRAFLLTLAPILRSGSNVLMGELRSLPSAKGLDVVATTIQSYWSTQFRQLHDAHGIHHFETVILAISRGAGTLRQDRPPLRTRMTDALRLVSHRALARRWS